MWGANTEGAASARPARLLRSRRLLLEAPAAFQDCARRVVHHLRGRSRLALSPTTSCVAHSHKLLLLRTSAPCNRQTSPPCNPGGVITRNQRQLVLFLCVTGAETTVSGAVLEQFSELPHAWSILYVLTRSEHITVSRCSFVDTRVTVVQREAKERLRRERRRGEGVRLAATPDTKGAEERCGVHAHHPLPLYEVGFGGFHGLDGLHVAHLWHYFFRHRYQMAPIGAAAPFPDLMVSRSCLAAGHGV